MESSPLVEQLSAGITLERLHDGQILVFTITDVSRMTLDSWVNAIKSNTAGWRDDQKYFALNHFDGKNVSLTPYLRAKIEELADWRPAQRGCVAMVLPRTFFAKLMTLFLPAMKSQNIQSRLFFTRDEGLAWLEKSLAKELA